MYAADLIRALENSNSPVPEELRRLDEEYQQKVQDGEIERRKTNVGFTGKGFEFNEEEANKVKELRKALSKAYGVSSGNRNDNADDEDDELLLLAEGAGGGKSEKAKEEEAKRQEYL